MNNKTKTVNEQTESVGNAEQGGLSNNLSKLNKLDKMKVVASLSSSYLELKVGESKNFMFINVSSIYSEDKGVDVPAVVLMDNEQNRFITAAKLIVETFITVDGELLLEPFTCVQIDFVEQVTTKSGGKYNKYKISLLG